MRSDNAILVKRSILAAFIGTALMASTIATNTTSSAKVNGMGIGTSCPYTAKCPLDDADSNYVSSEFSGIKEIGIYENALVGGGKHRFRVRCN